MVVAIGYRTGQPLSRRIITDRITGALCRRAMGIFESSPHAFTLSDRSPLCNSSLCVPGRKESRCSKYYHGRMGILHRYAFLADSANPCWVPSSPAALAGVAPLNTELLSKCSVIRSSCHFYSRRFGPNVQRCLGFRPLASLIEAQLPTTFRCSKCPCLLDGSSR
jgi:hypothetical protein